MVITIKSMYTVTPAEETPICVMYLSDFDHIIGIAHSPTIHFFRQPSSQSPLNPYETLKHSLSKALSIFYPLAGRLQWTSSSRERLEINCNSAGALLIEAESDSSVDDFGDFCPTADVTELVPSQYYKSLPIDQQPLLLVQITKFRCGGLSLGLSISHIVFDGMGASLFMSGWSRIARGEEPQNFPFFDRTLLKPMEGLPPPCFDHSDYKKTPLVVGHPNNLEERRRETTPAMLRLSKDQVEILRNKANKSGQRYSRYEAVSAHIWRCASKARGHQNDQETVLRVMVDIRNRIKPNLPKWYFGNAVVPVAATTTAGELLVQPLGYACGKIREAVNKVNDEYIKSYLSYLKNEKDLAKVRDWHAVGAEVGPFYGNPNLSVTSWLSVPLMGTDFGWGKDIHMGPGLLGYDGKSFMFPGRDEEGSVVVAQRLQTAHTDAFNKFFYGDI